MRHRWNERPNTTRSNAMHRHTQTHTKRVAATFSCVYCDSRLCRSGRWKMKRAEWRCESSGCSLVNVNNSNRTTFDNGKTHDDNMAGWASVSNGRKTLLHFDRLCVCVAVRVRATVDTHHSRTETKSPKRESYQQHTAMSVKGMEENEKRKISYNHQQQQVAFLNRLFRRCFRLSYTCLLADVFSSRCVYDMAHSVYAPSAWWMWPLYDNFIFFFVFALLPLWPPPPLPSPLLFLFTAHTS